MHHLHNTSSSRILLSFPILEGPCELISSILPRHDEGVMFLFHASTSLTFFLLLIHLSSLLLIKLIITLCQQQDSHRDVEHHSTPHAEENLSLPATADDKSTKRDLVADVILGGEGLLFLYSESTSEDTLFAEQGKDSKEAPIYFDKEDTLVSESAYNSPLVQPPDEEKVGVEHSEELIIDEPIPSVCPSPIEEKSIEVETYENKEKKEISEDQIFLIDNSQLESKKLQVEDVHEDKEIFGGSLTGNSTSKSSMEWRSSTILRDSESEYPFTSSSRRSSAHWESYTVFRKYDEEMMFFDNISAQKLTETESFRSLRHDPRSISQRIVHKLSTKRGKNIRQQPRDPYLELESTYVAQICLTWEALNCNYTKFQRVVNTSRAIEDSGCPAQIAQQFQQFQVLLQRFIENEPYERGRRPEVFARVRISSPKLLRVPEFHESEDDEDKVGTSSRISSAEFLAILEDGIRTFMNFLKADKESHCQKFRAFIKKKHSSVDQNFLQLLKKVNSKKKMRLKEIGRRKNCLVKRKLDEERELDILMGLIDLRIVSRVLRMPEISEEQLHWCEEKMSKVRACRDGKIYRDSSTLFFPAH